MRQAIKIKPVEMLLMADLEKRVHFNFLFAVDTHTELINNPVKGTENQTNCSKVSLKEEP
jgi:hypothetical protein